MTCPCLPDPSNEDLTGPDPPPDCPTEFDVPTGGGGGGGSGGDHGCEIRYGGGSVSSGSGTLFIPFDTLVKDTDSFWNISDPTKIKFATIGAGNFLVSYMLQGGFSFTGATNYTLQEVFSRIYLNGAEKDKFRDRVTCGQRVLVSDVTNYFTLVVTKEDVKFNANFILKGTMPLTIAAGSDYVQLHVQNDLGLTLSIGYAVIAVHKIDKAG